MITSPAAILPTRERVALVARAIGPILNRVVLAGPAAVDLLTTEAGTSPPGITFAEDATLQLLTTSMVDRLGTELAKHGLIRASRSNSTDRWRSSAGLEINLVQVRADDADPAQVWLEYATLLTVAMDFGDQLIVRVAGAPALLALELDTFAKSGTLALDSEEVERVVILLTNRAETEREVTAAPPELRSMIGSSLTRLLRDDTLQIVLQRVIPDASLLPAIAARVRERMVRLAC